MNTQQQTPEQTFIAQLESTVPQAAVSGAAQLIRVGRNSIRVTLADCYMWSQQIYLPTGFSLSLAPFSASGLYRYIGPDPAVSIANSTIYALSYAPVFVQVDEVETQAEEIAELQLYPTGNTTVTSPTGSVNIPVSAGLWAPWRGSTMDPNFFQKGFYYVFALGSYWTVEITEFQTL